MELTTLQAEFEFLRMIRNDRMAHFRPPQYGSTPDQILSILLAHVKHSVEIKKPEQARLRNTIATCVRKKQAIPITLTWALGYRVPNPLKYLEKTNLPTLAWLYAFHTLYLVQLEVQEVYGPGVVFHIFEESPLFGRFFDVYEIEIYKCLQAALKMLDAIGLSYVAHSLTKDLFPESAIKRYLPKTLEPDLVYAVVASLREVTDPGVLEPLYQSRRKNFPELRRLVGDSVWKKAEVIGRYIRGCLTYRKAAKLFEKISGHKEILDATITEKEGRLSFGITSPALPNHGMPIVEKRADYYKLEVIPEYRLQSGSFIPIVIDPSQAFGVSEQPYTFYYLT